MAADLPWTVPPTAAGTATGTAADIAVDITVYMSVAIRGTIRGLLWQTVDSRGNVRGAPQLATDITATIREKFKSFTYNRDNCCSLRTSAMYLIKGLAVFIPVL